VWSVWSAIGRQVGYLPIGDKTRQELPNVHCKVSFLPLDKNSGHCSARSSPCSVLSFCLFFLFCSPLCILIFVTFLFPYYAHFYMSSSHLIIFCVDQYADTSLTIYNYTNPYLYLFPDPFCIFLSDIQKFLQITFPPHFQRIS